MAGHLILLCVPCQRHIPYFAIGYPSSRENRVGHLDLGTDLARLVGRRCAAWIKARAGRDGIEFLATQNYIPPQTAFHAKWLRIQAAEVVTEFLDTFPQ